MLFRVILSSLVLVCLISSSACKRGGPQRTEGGGISLDQNVTEPKKPQDPIFIDFQKNWRQFISPRPELALPVIAIPKEQQPRSEALQPEVSGKCVFSADAGGFVPQVIVMWNEAPVQVPSPVIGFVLRPVKLQTPQPTPPQAADLSRLRFDLAVHFQGFEKNEFTSTVAIDKEKRFNLPSNSNFISNSDALLLTGPSLFPKVIDFKTETVRERDTNREIPQSTLVMRDLGQGVAYRLRVSTLGQNQWNETRQFVFTTPICPKDF